MEEHQCWQGFRVGKQRSVQSLRLSQRDRTVPWPPCPAPVPWDLDFRSSLIRGAREEGEELEQRSRGRRAGAGGGEERPGPAGPGSAHLGPGGAAGGARPLPLAPSPVRAVRSGRGAADKEPGPSGHRGQEGAARGRGRGGGGGQRHRGAEPGRGAAEPRAALAGNKRLLLPAPSAVARAPPHHVRLRAPPCPGAAAARPLQPERCPAPPAPVSTGDPAAASLGIPAGQNRLCSAAAPGGSAEQSPRSARSARDGARCPRGARVRREGTERRKLRAKPALSRSAERPQSFYLAAVI